MSKTQTSAVQTGSTGKIVRLDQAHFRFLHGLVGSGRGLLARLMGGSHQGARDYYEVFGWDRNVDSRQMWHMYSRGGIARRIVHAYPDAVWGNPPEFEGGTAAWKTAWEALVEDQNLWSVFHRLDRLSQLGQYAILVVGTDDGLDLSRPLREGSRKILYLQPYSDRSALITQWGTDPTQVTFNMPTEYTIYPDVAALEAGAGSIVGAGKTSVSPSRGTFKVHHSRVIHVTQDHLESNVFGTPKLWAVWNYLTDLQKVVGGSAESYWLTANRGMHADLDKEIDLEPEDEAALTEEIEEYQHGLRRFIRTRGVKVQSLGTDVANPEGPFQTLITLIAGTTGIPMRILIGSEAGHNASTQDKGAFAEHVEEYRKLVATPNFLWPFLKFVTAMGALPTVKMTGTKKLKSNWPSAYILSPLEASQRANQQSTAANNLGLAAKTMKNLFGRQEARMLIGLAADDKGDELDIVVAPATTGRKAGDGGVETAGPGAGTTATPGTDSNGRGDTVQQPK